MALVNAHATLYVTLPGRFGRWDRFDHRFWRATILEFGALEVRYGKSQEDYSVRVYAPGQWLTYEAK